MDRELKKEFRAAKFQSEERRNRISSILWGTFFIILFLALIGYVAWNIMKPLSGTKVEVMPSRNHVSVGTKPTYNSSPPTSGEHYAETEEWGIYDKPLSAEKLVHNLEHGGIVIYYHCPDVCETLVKQLTDAATRLMRKDRKVIVAPNELIDSKIVLSAWGWLDKMDEVDEERIWRFFDDHINRAPERVF